MLCLIVCGHLSPNAERRAMVKDMLVTLEKPLDNFGQVALVCRSRSRLCVRCITVKRCRKQFKICWTYHRPLLYWSKIYDLGLGAKTYESEKQQDQDDDLAECISYQPARRAIK